ncbi:MAG: peptide deformylase [Candidatus Zixiibacteriota bacterium]
MAVRPIVLYGHPALREKSAEVDRVDQETKDIVADMIATLKDAQGLGLAANQIGLAKRIFLVDMSGIDPDEDVRVFINPVILETSGETEYEEGCLSFPDIYETITRAATVKIRALNLDGEEYELQADGMLARVILHEYDHIEGKLFIDYFSPMAKQLISGKLRKLKAASAA